MTLFKKAKRTEEKPEILTLGGFLGMAVSTPGIVKKEKRSAHAVMFGGGALCTAFAGLLFVGYKKE